MLGEIGAVTIALTDQLKLELGQLQTGSVVFAETEQLIFRLMSGK